MKEFLFIRLQSYSEWQETQDYLIKVNYSLTCSGLRGEGAHEKPMNTVFSELSSLSFC